jgi:hypothetical protein
MQLDSPPRTEEQLAWYWAAVVPAFAAYWDVEAAEAHRRLKDLANYGRSTTTLTRRGWSDFLDRCQRLAAHGGIVVERGASDDGHS